MVRVNSYTTMAQAKKTINRGTLWTDDECEQLRSEFEQGVSVKDIAMNHQRTVKAIEHRLAQFAAEDVLQGVSAPDAASKYRVTESMVNQKIRQNQNAKQPPLKERVTQLEARVEQLEQMIAAMTKQ